MAMTTDLATKVINRALADGLPTAAYWTAIRDNIKRIGTVTPGTEQSIRQIFPITLAAVEAEECEAEAKAQADRHEINMMKLGRRDDEGLI